MKVPWPLETCVRCGATGSMTSEHVIPEVLGGILEAPILCAGCNSWLGAEIDCQVQRDDSLRLAVMSLGDRIPMVRDRVLHRMEVQAVSDMGAALGDVRRGEFKIRRTRLGDGSLVQSTEDGREAIENILRKAGVDDSGVIDALAKSDAAPFGERVSVHPGLDVIHWRTRELRPVLSGAAADDRLFVKIALEFLCLTLGRAARHEGIALVWNDLRDAGQTMCAAKVEYLQDTEYDVFHGIAIEQNQPVVRVQLRLFGKLASRITFPRLAVNGPRWVYTHRLDSGDDGIAQW